MESNARQVALPIGERRWTSPHHRHTIAIATPARYPVEGRLFVQVASGLRGLLWVRGKPVFPLTNHSRLCTGACEARYATLQLPTHTTHHPSPPSTHHSSPPHPSTYHHPNLNPIWGLISPKSAETPLRVSGFPTEGVPSSLIFGHVSRSGILPRNCVGAHVNTAFLLAGSRRHAP